MTEPGGKRAIARTIWLAAALGAGMWSLVRCGMDAKGDSRARDDERRQASLARYDSILGVAVNAASRSKDTGAPIDRITSRLGWPARSHGTDGRWKWSCLQAPDSGIFAVLAWDSGCARSSGEFWSISQRTVSLMWDGESRTMLGMRSSSSTRSLWSHPGEARLCVGEPDPEPDSARVEAWCSKASNP